MSLGQPKENDTVDNLPNKSALSAYPKTRITLTFIAVAVALIGQTLWCWFIVEQVRQNLLGI